MNAYLSRCDRGYIEVVGRPRRFSSQPSTTSLLRRNRREADHFVAAQRLEERLKAATDQAAHPTIDDLHVADTDGRCDITGWGAADERHLDSSAHEFICHGCQVAPRALSAESSGLRIGCVVRRAYTVCAAWPGRATDWGICPPRRRASSAAGASWRRSERSSAQAALSVLLGRGVWVRLDSHCELPPILRGGSPTAPGWSSWPMSATGLWWPTQSSRPLTSEIRRP